MPVARKNLKLGEMLIEAGIIDTFQLNSALSHQRTHGGRLGASLIKLGYLGEERLLNFLADQLNCPRVDLKHLQIPMPLLKYLPEDKARQFNVIPVEKREGSGVTTLVVAMADPTNLTVIDSLQFITGCRIRPAIATESSIRHALDSCFGTGVPPEAELPVEEPTPSASPSQVKTVKSAPAMIPPGEERSAPLPVDNARLLEVAGKLEALLAKLLDLGVLTRQEHDEIASGRALTVSPPPEAEEPTQAEAPVAPQAGTPQPEAPAVTRKAPGSTEERLRALLAKLLELEVLTREELDAIAAGQASNGGDPVSGSEQGGLTGEVIRALLAKLNELGVLTRQEHDEIASGRVFADQEPALLAAGERNMLTLRALLAKLHELGVLTDREHEELV